MSLSSRRRRSWDSVSPDVGGLGDLEGFLGFACTSDGERDTELKDTLGLSV